MLTRRSFLVNGMRVAAAVPLLPCLGQARSRRFEDPILIVIQLTGGNDAINTVVPHRQDAYYQLRPTLALQRGALHALDDDHGLNPAMNGLGELYAEGNLAVVHGVGYPVPNRSPFRSMEIWHTADLEEPVGNVGWMGRMADEIASARPSSLAALHVGTGKLPLALYGRNTFAPTVRDVNGFQLKEPGRLAAYRDRALAAGAADGELAFLREAATTTYSAATRMQAVLDEDSGGDYPGFELAQRLKLIAQLVAGGFDTRVFHVELGGFDTHARQAPAHAALLTELSRSLTAFQRDLEARGVSDRVVTLVFSEFGRRVAENGSRGTDHGAGAPVFLVGSRVRGGMLGAPPDLLALEEGDVPYSTDFRSIYTTLEQDWMKLTPSTGIAGLDFLAG